MAGPDHSKSVGTHGAQPLTDEEVESFVANLEATVESFRRKPLPPAPETVAPPIRNPDPAPPLPESKPLPAPAAGAPVPPLVPAAPAPSHGLLDELRTAAALQVASDERLRQDKAKSDARVGIAMRQLWTYLNELSRHLNTLKPAVPQRYRIGPKAELEDLEWAGAFIDYRSVSSGESAALDTISLNYTLSAPGTVSVERTPQHAGRYQEELALLRLQYTFSEHQDKPGKVDSVLFEIERKVKVSLHFKAQFESGRIVLRANNFNGFGPAAYALTPDAVTTGFLDDFGRFILGRPNHLFAVLTPIRLHE